jgi:hypothetical protein
VNGRFRMKRCSLLLILTLAATGCAAPPRAAGPAEAPPTEWEKALLVREWDAATRQWVPVAHQPAPAPVPAPMPAQEGASGGQVAAAILLAPLWIPLLALGTGSGGVSCKGKVYADGTKWRSSCY